MARLWEKMLWAALCGTALGWAGCKPTAREQKALPPPVTEAPPDVAPVADAASAGDAVDPDDEGITDAIDDASSGTGDLTGDADAPEAKKDAKKLGRGTGKLLPKIKINNNVTYGPPPSME